MSAPVGFDALGERLDVGGFERRSGAAALAGNDRVVALEQQCSAGAGLLARVSERDGVYGAQSVIALAAGAISEHPPAALFVYDA